MQIFRPGANSLAVIALAAIPAVLVLGVGAAYAVMRSSYVTEQDVTRDQPVPFSHKHHAGELGIDCRYCHQSVATARFAGMPPTETCMTCHSQIWTNAAMLAPVRESLARGAPLHWRRVHDLPDYVYFDHSVHIGVGVGCSSCHGDVTTMPLTRQAAPLTMSWCLDCHRDPAKALRPASEVFNQEWKPPADQRKRGEALLAAHNVSVGHLTDCSVCHR